LPATLQRAQYIPFARPIKHGGRALERLRGARSGGAGVRYLLSLRGALLLGLRGALLSRKKISICSEDLLVVRALF